MKFDFTWSPMDLIVDHKSGKLDFKKLALCTTAFLQSVTWIRMSWKLPVDSALYDWRLWVVFYCVVAGHELMQLFIKTKWGSEGNANTSGPA